ncbi:MAG: chorismate synthase [Planctomycetota bacterium]
MGNTFGRVFRVTTFGESHSPACGVVIDGAPPQMDLAEKDIQQELDRRKPGQSQMTSSRKELDQVRILSGLEDGKTLGTPILLLIENQDIRKEDYQSFENIFRPSHADFSYEKKYGIRAKSGGGRASARETVARVAAGAIAKKFLKEKFQIEIVAWVHSIHHLSGPEWNEARWITPEEVEQNPIRCPYPELAPEMISLIEQIKQSGDSVGGTIRSQIRGVPAGWGEPVFDKLEAELGKALLSIPACKGIEFGSGFAGTLKKGSEQNDAFYLTDDHQVSTRTNYSGGIQGGISNGQWILLRVAFKPTATIQKTQETLTSDLKSVLLKASGRHDPCVLPRAVPIVEAMIALVLMDAYLLQSARENSILRQKKSKKEVP